MKKQDLQNVISNHVARTQFEVPKCSWHPGCTMSAEFVWTNPGGKSRYYCKYHHDDFEQGMPGDSKDSRWSKV